MVKQKLSSILLVVILLLSISISSFASESVINNAENIENGNQENNFINNIENIDNIDDLNNQKNETQNKIEEINSQIEYVKTEMSNTLLEIQELDDKIRSYEQENENLNTRLQELETSITETTANLEKVTKDYEQKEALLKERLVAIYEAGDIAYLDVLLSANSLSEFLEIYNGILEMAEYDNALISEVDEQLRIIRESKEKLETENKEVTELKAKAEQSEVILRNTKTLQEGKMQNLSEKEKEFNDQMQEYKNNMLAIEARIQELSGYEGEIIIQYTGTEMIWPVAINGTKITSYYGTREHPIEGIIKLHQGIDIGNTGYGAPAVSVLDGIVTYAGELGSYGNCVMVYHGNGITTLYGHGQEVLVQRGQEVKQGEIILKTGSTGNSTGPHLHFEVRINGSTQDPLKYVNAP